MSFCSRVEAMVLITRWDSAGVRITNLPEANRHVRTEYRPGWSLGV